MNEIRNCLEHRAGVVHPVKDAGGKPAMSLKLPKLALLAVDGDREIELRPGTVLENGGDVLLKAVIRRFDYPVGARITFTPDEFGEIAMACWMMAGEIVGKLPRPPQQIAS